MAVPTGRVIIRPGALLIAGLEQKKGVEREPVGVLKFPQKADGCADGHDHGQAQGKAHLKIVETQPPAAAGKYLPPGHPGPPGPGLSLRQQQEQAVEKAAVEDTQPPLRQGVLCQQDLEPFCQRSPCLRRSGVLELPHQPRQRNQHLPAGGASLEPPPILVRQEVAQALKQQCKQVIKPPLPIWQVEVAAAGIAQPPEPLGQPLQLPARPVRPAAPGQFLQQLRQAGQAPGDLLLRRGGRGRQPGIEEQRPDEHQRTEQQAQHLNRKFLRRGRPELQEHESHGVAEVALRRELVALEKHQRKGNREVQKHTEHHIPAGQIGEHTQQEGDEQQLDVICTGVVALPPDLKQGGGAGHHHGVPAPEQE